MEVFMRSVLHRKVLARFVVGVSAAVLLLPMLLQQQLLLPAPSPVVLALVACSLAALLGMPSLRVSRRRVTARARA
jgi:hypothetical protein